MDKPKKTEWEVIQYHPQPFVTILKDYGAEKYWTERGCTIEVIPEDHGWCKHLVRGVKVQVTWPADKIEQYVEPLATMHKQFFDELSTVLWDTYPYGKRPHKFVSELHSIVARAYWDADWQDFTPQTWWEALTNVLNHIQEKPFKLFRDQRKYENQFIEFNEFIKSSLTP